MRSDVGNLRNVFFALTFDSKTGQPAGAHVSFKDTAAGRMNLVSLYHKDEQDKPVL